MDKATLYFFMTRARYGVVSSLAADGTPQSALVGVAIVPDLEIVFDTLRTTRKYDNLLARPACSVVLWWVGNRLSNSTALRSSQPVQNSIAIVRPTSLHGPTAATVLAGLESPIWWSSLNGSARRTTINRRRSSKRCDCQTRWDDSFAIQPRVFAARNGSADSFVKTRSTRSTGAGGASAIVTALRTSSPGSSSIAALVA